MRVVKLHRAQRRAAWIVLILGLIFAVCYRYVDFPFASGQLGYEWERAKKNGIALESKDLLPNPPIVDSENAALDLIALGSQVRAARSGIKPATLPAGSSAADKNFAENQRLYEAAKPFFGQIAQALQKPKYYVPRDYDLSFEVLFPELADTKAIAKAYSHSALLKAKTGDVDGCIKDLNTGLRLSERISQDETLIAFLVAQALYAIEIDGAAKACNELATNEGAIKRIRKEVVQPSKYPNDFEHAMRIEMCWGIYMLRNTKRYGGIWKMKDMLSGMGGPDSVPKIDKNVPIVRTGFPSGIIAKAFASQNLRYWNDVLESKEWKSKNWQHVGEFMDKKVVAESFQNTRKLSHIANDVLMPVFAQAGYTMARAEARKRSVRSMLLVLEYKARTGQYPASLKDANAEAEDPFAKGQKLHYATDGKSSRIWSIGIDSKDDGGDPKKNNDIVTVNPPVK